MPGASIENPVLHRGRRVLLILLVIGLLVGAARIAAPGKAHPAKFSAALMCGSQRWLVKTLQDRPRLLPAKATTVAELDALHPPTPFPTRRTPFERHVYSVVAAVTLVRPEFDRDLHVVLKSDGNQMIAESPTAPACTATASPVRRQEMASARAHVHLCAKARVVGVVFWDFKHGQTGVAPNGIELHPILGFACLVP
jgi:hypothetical protein